jgi:hypothetical protein
MTHMTLVLQEVLPVDGGEAYADISAEDFARNKQAPVALILVTIGSVPSGCVTVTPVGGSNVVQQSGGHTSIEIHLDSRIVHTLTKVEPSGEVSSMQREVDVNSSRPLKTTAREVVANIEQGGFAKDQRHSEPGSGSVPVHVANAKEDQNHDQHDARSERTSVRALLHISMKQTCFLQTWKYQQYRHQWSGRTWQ